VRSNAGMAKRQGDVDNTLAWLGLAWLGLAWLGVAWPLTHFIHPPMKMEPIVSSETSAIRTQTPGNYPKMNKLQICLCFSCALDFLYFIMAIPIIVSARERFLYVFKIYTYSV